MTRFAKRPFISPGEALGLVFGWAVICKEDGYEYFDTQDDHVDEHGMIKAATSFMLNRRTMKVMHRGEVAGRVVFAMPITSEIAKALGIESRRSGLIVAVKPSSNSTLALVRSGVLGGFSIGGQRIRDEEVQ